MTGSGPPPPPSGLREVEFRILDRPGRIALAGYALLCAAVLLQYPLHDGIGGNGDTWHVIALSNTLANLPGDFIRGGEAGASLHPAGNPLAFGESSPGTALFFILFRLLGLPDVEAYYGYLCTLLTLSAFGAYTLARQYGAGTIASSFSGVAMALSNFTFANIDDPIVLFYLPATLSLVYLKRYLKTGSGGHLVRMALWAGGQVYFSAYVFLFTGMMIAVVMAANFRSVLSRGAVRPAVALTGSALIAAPFFLFYLHTVLTRDVYNPWKGLEVGVAELHSLDPIDLTRPLADNLIYPEHSPNTLGWITNTIGLLVSRDRLIQLSSTQETVTALRTGPTPAGTRIRSLVSYISPTDEFPYVSLRKRALLGITIYLLAIMGLFSTAPRRWELAALATAGFLVSLGPAIALSDRIVPLPLMAAYHHLPGMALLRMPLRAFFVTLLALSILAALGIDRHGRRLRFAQGRTGMIVGTALMAALFVMENLPIPLRTYPARTYTSIPDGYLSFFQKVRGPVTILDLPSQIGGSLERSNDPLYAFTREAVYMNWQTRHRQNLINGVNGYLPRTRIRAQQLIDRLPEPAAFEELGRDFGLEYLVFHPPLVLRGETGVEQRLRTSDCLEHVFEDDQVAIFRYVPDNCRNDRSAPLPQQTGQR